MNIADNAISDYGMHAVKTILQNSRIQHLNLASNMISEQGLDLIVDEFSKSNTLKSIDLGILEGSIRKNSFGIEGAKSIAAILLQNKTIETLRL